MDTVVFKTFLELEERKRKLNEDLKSVNEQITAINDVIINAMANAGMDKVTFNGRTVYIHTRIAAKKLADDGALCDALKDTGLGDFVKIGANTKTLSSYLAELVKNGEPIPEKLQPVLSYHEIQSVRSCKA